MNAIIFRPSIVSGLLLIVVGCGGGDGGNLPATVDASGVVTLDGEPVEGASVVFVSEQHEYPCVSATDSSGRFDLNAFEAKPGAVPGSYQVQVTKTIEIQGKAPTAADLGPDAAHAAKDPKAGVSWKNALPEKYANPKTSEITVQIPDTGTNDIQIKLVSKPPG